MTAAPEISIKVKGDRAAAASLLAVGERGSDIRPLRPTLQPIFAEDERTRFDLDGPGWKPLDEVTIALKRRLGQDTRILRATGALHESLTKPTAGVDLGMNSSPTELRFGTDVSYAYYHQYEHGVPKRVVIEPRLATTNRMARAVQTYVAEGLP